MKMVMKKDQNPLQNTNLNGETLTVSNSCCQTLFMARRQAAMLAKPKANIDAVFSPRTQQVLPQHTKTTEKAVRKSKLRLLRRSSIKNVNIGVQEETMDTKATPPYNKAVLFVSKDAPFTTEIGSTINASESLGRSRHAAAKDVENMCTAVMVSGYGKPLFIASFTHIFTNERHAK